MLRFGTYIVVMVLCVLSNLQIVSANNEPVYTESQSEFKPPNIILFLADDVGFGDFQSYGHPTQEYGEVDRMAKEGLRFTQWNAPASMCSPSRLAMLTGRYAVRSGMFGDWPVFISWNPNGLPREEVTIPEMLKSYGYRTGMVGKWHLGINKENSTDGYHLPHHHGFDFVGTNLPLSNNPFCNPKIYNIQEMGRWCFVYNGSKIVQQPADFTTLTDRMLSDAKHFIRSAQNDNFFFYFSFSQTHSPLYNHPRFTGSSKRGEYGDNINEMAASVTEILDLLKELKIHENTLALFLSDHGPERSGCPNGGDSGPFKGGKGYSWEGGFRVPAIAWWPSRIPAGTISTTPINTLDLFPTLKELVKNKYVEGDITPQEPLSLDGVKINSILRHAFKQGCKEEKTEPRVMFYYCHKLITAVRYGKYKLHYMVKPFLVDDKAKDCNNFTIEDLNIICSCKPYKKCDPLVLFDIESDIGEEFPLDVSKYQDLINTINEITEKHRSTIVDVKPLLTVGPPKIIPCCNPPKCICNYNINP